MKEGTRVTACVVGVRGPWVVAFRTGKYPLYAELEHRYDMKQEISLLQSTLNVQGLDRGEGS